MPSPKGGPARRGASLKLRGVCARRQSGSMPRRSKSVPVASWVCARRKRGRPAALVDGNAEATLEAAPQFPSLGREVPFETASDRIRSDDGAGSTIVETQSETQSGQGPMSGLRPHAGQGIACSVAGLPRRRSGSLPLQRRSAPVAALICTRGKRVRPAALREGNAGKWPRKRPRNVLASAVCGIRKIDQAGLAWGGPPPR